VAGGDDVPRKRSRGVVGSDLLVMNKTDLADDVDADLDTMARDARTAREGPFVFTNCKTGEGIDAVDDHLRRLLGLAEPG
jgi:urease accessory protein